MSEIAQQSSVRDQIEFEALPEDVRALAKRVLGPQSPETEPIDAYIAGWEDCAEEIGMPSPPSRERIAERLRG